MTADLLKCICVWLDDTTDYSEPKWIVSRDQLDDLGRAETTETLCVFEENSKGDAITEAIRRGQKSRLPVFETPEQGRRRRLEMTYDMDVKRLSDGEKVGTIELDADDWDRYSAGTHPAYQWPEGTAEAGVILADEALEEFGVRADTAIFLEG